MSLIGERRSQKPNGVADLQEILLLFLRSGLFGDKYGAERIEATRNGITDPNHLHLGCIRPLMGPALRRFQLSLHGAIVLVCDVYASVSCFSPLEMHLNEYAQFFSSTYMFCVYGLSIHGMVSAYVVQKYPLLDVQGEHGSTCG